MASSEKFCLRWNDFESNVSSAFREIRDEKDFFDVTLACDDDNQIQAHKVIIAACSPFFRNILRKNTHPSPLLYLKGVKYKDLVSVLNFMYMGEVNVAQDDLNQFLAVAEDLRVKGLTQGGGSSDNSSKSKSEPSKYPRPRESQLPSEPPSKRPRAVVPEVPSYEDEIQEVLPVKSEPGSAPTAGASHYDVSQDQNQVALDDQYDESYDYGQYGEGEGYEDGSGVIDPNTGLPLQTTDGNKGEEELHKNWSNSVRQSRNFLGSYSAQSAANRVWPVVLYPEPLDSFLGPGHSLFLYPFLFLTEAVKWL